MRYLILIFFTVLLGYACNPVKRVMNSPARMNQIAQEVIRRGYCANDTTIITQISDTIYVRTEDSIDTLVMQEGICNFDTILKSGTRIRFENGFLLVKEKIQIRTRVVTKQVDNYIKDTKLEDLLKGDISLYKDSLNTYKGMIEIYKDTVNNLNKKVDKTKLYLILLIAFIIISFVWKIYKKIKFPI